MQMCLPRRKRSKITRKNVKPKVSENFSQLGLKNLTGWVMRKKQKKCTARLVGSFQN